MSEDGYSINFVTSEDVRETSDIIVYPVATNEDDEFVSAKLPDLPRNQFLDFEADRFEQSLFYDGDFESDKLLLFGCGEIDDIETPEVPELSGKIINVLQNYDASKVTVVFPYQWDLDAERLSREFMLGLQLGGYEFDQYIHDDQEEDDDESEGQDLNQIDFHLEDLRSKSSVNRGYELGRNVSDAIEYARDLANTPSNDLVPYDLAEEAENLDEEFNDLGVEVWKQSKLSDEGMNLLQGVGQGSENPPCFIQFDYNPDDSQGTIAVAGKGVTFDTGGISIKPSKKMDEMKFDMGGSATVFGLMRAVASTGIPVRVLGFVPSAENMPGQNAIKPGDVITGYAGKSVEILNTDAEGRLCLADALGYLSEKYGEEVDCLLDFATLTGACITALGHEAAGLMGNDDELCETLMEVGQDVNEPVWQLPLWDDHSEQMESEISDVKNMGGEAGSITAGAFLREFVDEEKIEKWAHFDVAGTAWGMKELPHRPNGGTGFGVYLSLEFMKRFYSL